MTMNRRSPRSPFSLKVLRAFILASFVFLVLFPIQPDNDNVTTSLFLPFAPSSSQKLPFTLSSAAFGHGEAIPPSLVRAIGFNQEKSARSVDYSPPLTWSNIPDGTQSFVLIVDDPDAYKDAHATDDPQQAAAPNNSMNQPHPPWVHWVVYNIPPTTNTLGVGNSQPSYDLPPGTVQGLNGWNQVGYGGPMPTIDEHRYFFKLYALDIVLDNLRQEQYDSNTAAAAAAAGGQLQTPLATKAMVVQAMHGHVLGKAVLIGTYKRRSSSDPGRLAV